MGGQGIPNLDNDLAPYVAKSYIRNIANYLEITCFTDIDTLKREFIKPLDEYIRENKRIMNQEGREYITNYLKDKFDIYHINFTNMHEYATNKTERDTYQAMESMVHNLCSLASRAGGQVPFSSVNFGIDTTEEGRMVSRNIMLAIDAGLGSGETSIFPIAIMKLMSGVTDKGSPNYDLFQLSCKVSAKRLFPNWLSLDATFNKKYYKGTPETEVATMGMVDGGIVKIRHITNEGKIYLKDIDISELGDWLLEYNIGKVTKDENKEIDLRIYDIENVDILDSYYGGWTKLNIWIKTQDPSLRWYRIKTNKGTDRIFSHDHPLTAIIPEKHTSWQRIPVEDLSVGDKLMGTDQYNQVITSIEKVDENIVGYDVNTNSDKFDIGTINVGNCRTRVISNHFDPDNEITPGRGNLFFTTVNLPYLALQAKREYNTGKYTCTLYDVFMSMLNETIDEVFDLSMDRFEIIANKKAKNFPFLMGQGLYIGSDNLSPDDTIREVIKHGTITMGFIGLAETLVVLTGKHHGESEASQELGLKIISHMNQRCTDECHKTGLNFSLMGSPAEGCCGRLLKLTRKEFGTIPGVTDHEYLTNSHHRHTCGFM